MQEYTKAGICCVWRVFSKVYADVPYCDFCLINYVSKLQVKGGTGGGGRGGRAEES